MTVWISASRTVNLPTSVTWSNGKYWITVGLRLLRPCFERFPANEVFAWELDFGPVSITRVKTHEEIDQRVTS